MKIPLEWLNEYIDLKGKSPREIGDAFTALGLMLDKPFDGKVFDLEHRFDRSDWLSVLGCARDLAAYLKKDLKPPKVYTQEGIKPAKERLVNIYVECPDAVNRFNTRVFRNIKVRQSPDWLKRRLEDYGIPSINNVVDVTNYVMVELGQPMHAQDLSKFRKQEIVIRKAKNEEKLVTFLGDEVTLYPDAFVLTQDGIATVLGGIVGGRETGVDDRTTDIVLDAGNYNQNIIRRVSRKLKIQNETVLRYDKYLHPDLTEYAIQRAAELLLQVAGGEYYQNVDWNPSNLKPKDMVLHKLRIGKVSGFDIPTTTVSDTLRRLGYILLKQNDNEFHVEVPYFRTDIEVEDDLVSDILRVYGYSNISSAQIAGSLPKDITPEINNFEENLRDSMILIGAHEHITDPLVSLNENTVGEHILLENSQNSSKNTLRTSLYGNLQDIASVYQKNRVKSGILFEVGKVYTQRGNKRNYASYTETRVLECFLFDKEQSPKDIYKNTSSFLNSFLINIGVDNFQMEKHNDKPEATITAQNSTIGQLRYNGFTLLTENLLSLKRNTERVVSDIQTSNTIETSLIIPKEYPVGNIINAIRSKSADVLKVEFIDEYGGNELEDNKRYILLKTHFSGRVASSEAIKTIGQSINKLPRSEDIVVRK